VLCHWIHHGHLTPTGSSIHILLYTVDAAARLAIGPFSGPFEMSDDSIWVLQSVSWSVMSSDSPWTPFYFSKYAYRKQYSFTFTTVDPQARLAIGPFSDPFTECVMESYAIGFTMDTLLA
jgi:hypothetical protein